jgi:hypothetical protein
LGNALESNQFRFQWRSRVDRAPLDESAKPFKATINSKNPRKAAALASLVRDEHDFGNVSIRVVVLANGTTVTPFVPTSAEELKDVILTALTGNPLFHEVRIKSVFKPTVFPMFKKEVIQFYNDDHSDYFGNYNGVCSTVFRELLFDDVGRIPLNCSSAC